MFSVQSDIFRKGLEHYPHPHIYILYIYIYIIYRIYIRPCTNSQQGLLPYNITLTRVYIVYTVLYLYIYIYIVNEGKKRADWIIWNFSETKCPIYTNFSDQVGFRPMLILCNYEMQIQHLEKMRPQKLEKKKVHKVAKKSAGEGKSRAATFTYK